MKLDKEKRKRQCMSCSEQTELMSESCISCSSLFRVVVTSEPCSDVCDFRAMFKPEHCPGLRPLCTAPVT